MSWLRFLFSWFVIRKPDWMDDSLTPEQQDAKAIKSDWEKVIGKW